MKHHGVSLMNRPCKLLGYQLVLLMITDDHYIDSSFVFHIIKWQSFYMLLFNILTWAIRQCCQVIKYPSEWWMYCTVSRSLVRPFWSSAFHMETSVWMNSIQMTNLHFLSCFLVSPSFLIESELTVWHQKILWNRITWCYVHFWFLWKVFYWTMKYFHYSWTKYAVNTSCTLSTLNWFLENLYIHSTGL